MPHIKYKIERNLVNRMEIGATALPNLMDIHNRTRVALKAQNDPSQWEV